MKLIPELISTNGSHDIEDGTWLRTLNDRIHGQSGTVAVGRSSLTPLRALYNETVGVTDAALEEIDNEELKR